MNDTAHKSEQENVEGHSDPAPVQQAPTSPQRLSTEDHFAVATLELRLKLLLSELQGLQLQATYISRDMQVKRVELAGKQKELRAMQHDFAERYCIDFARQQIQDDGTIEAVPPQALPLQVPTHPQA